MSKISEDSISAGALEYYLYEEGPELIEEETPPLSLERSMNQAKRPLEDRIKILGTKNGWDTILVDEAIKIKQISKKIRYTVAFYYDNASISLFSRSTSFFFASLILITSGFGCSIMDILGVILINQARSDFDKFTIIGIKKNNWKVDIALAVAELRSILLYPEMYSDRYKQDKLRSFRESKRLNSIELEKKVLTTAEKSMQSFLIEEQNNSYKNS